MNLIIVESPTKERTISKFVASKGKDFVVKSSYGHIRDLPARELGVDVKNKFAPKYIVLPKTKKNLEQLIELSKKSDTVYLATDYDREGEAIAWHLAYLLKLDDKKSKRITFHEITPEAINDALKNPREIDVNLVNSQQARRILDRLFGYKLSPLLWKKIKSGLSAGRVQSVTVRLICDREEEINKFVSQEYWSIKVELKKELNNFFAELIQIDGNKLDKLDLKNKEQVDKSIENIGAKKYIVDNVVNKEKKRQPPTPLTTALLQQESSKALRYSPSKTMFIAQQLYEGVNIGETGQIGLITYMRTDSMNIAKSAQEEALKFIEKRFGKEYIPGKPRIYKTKSKNAQEAHEAIRPTSAFRDPESIKQYLSEEQYKMYNLIWARFIASQMKEALYDTTSVDILADNLLFRSTGKVLKFSGFLKVYQDIEEEQKNNDTLPVLVKNDMLTFIQCIPEQHFTEPPPRYTEATLIKELEKNGIGRPSTYAPIVETIKFRKYVTLQEHKFFPTQLGIQVNDLLKNNFSDIVDINFTAKIEDKLDEIGDGKLNWNKVVSEFYKPFEEKLALAEKNVQKQKPVQVVSEEKCPVCAAVMYVIDGRYGKYLSCSQWPQCKSRIPLDRAGNKKVVEKLDEKCPQCQNQLVKRKGRRGWFIACSGFPRCKYIRSIDKE